MARQGRETLGNESLGKWEFLGSGGFGLVYTAEHKDWGKVVIKLPHDDGSIRSYSALCREADYMEAADHQYVPRVYGMYQGPVLGLGSKKRCGIVMELMEGGSLQSLQETLSQSQAKPPPWPLAFRLAHQVALAMDFLHGTKNLVHMDLKPDNILLDGNLNAKIADFGLCTVSNSVKETTGERKGGTLSYTPPEAFEDDYRRVRSYDVYSYGILLWTILTGDKPYPEADPSLVSFRIKRGDRPLLDKMDVHQAAGLEDLVELMTRCWDPEPNKRPSFRECVEVTSRVFSRHEEGTDAAVCEVLKQLTTSEEQAEPEDVEAELTPGNRFRTDLLQYSCQISLDENTANNKLILSEENRKVTRTDRNQRRPNHEDRFTYYPQVLSREPLSDRCYFEVEWSGDVGVAVSYKDIDRVGESSLFGFNNMSWRLGYFGSSYIFRHNSTKTVLPPTTVGGRPRGWAREVFGVDINQRKGSVSFYTVDNNTLTLLLRVNTAFTQPLYAGIWVYGTGDTAEVCKIWQSESS